MKRKLTHIFKNAYQEHTLSFFTISSLCLVVLSCIVFYFYLGHLYNDQFTSLVQSNVSISSLQSFGQSKDRILTNYVISILVLYGFGFLAFRYYDSRMKKANSQLKEAKGVTLYALATLAETRDAVTGKHLERTSQYVEAIANELRHLPHYKNYLTDEYIEDLVRSAPLHDIGKVGIRDSILLKPGKLTELEFEHMKKHCTIGSDTLQNASSKLDFQSFLSIAIQLSHYHHEKWNGKGYPDGLDKLDIPLSARIMALADVYDALRSQRPYKEPMSHFDAKVIIVADSGRHFDPEVVDAFLKQEEVFIQISKNVS